LTVPAITLLGLNEGAVRAPAAFWGALTILATYLLGSTLFSRRVGLVSAGLMAISPWHLQFSRIAFRGILLPFFIALGLYLFIWALRRRTGWLPVAFAVFGIGLYTYSPARVVIPLIVLFLLFHYRSDCKRAAKPLGFGLLLFLIIAFPVARFSLSDEGQQRYSLMSIFDKRTLDREVTALTGGQGPLNDLVADTKTGKATLVFAHNYLTHFGPRFLLYAGDVNLRHSPTGVGQLNWAEWGLFMAGLVLALKRRGRHLLPLFCILIAPLPGSLTTDNVPNALRGIAALPATQLLAGVALVALGEQVSAARSLWSRRLSRVGLILIVAVGLAGCGFHLMRYFTRYRVEAAPWWDYGYREVIAYCEAHRERYPQVVILAPSASWMIRYANNPFAFAFPLFYTACDPRVFQETGRPGRYALLLRREPGGVSDAQLQPGTLYVMRPDQVGSALPIRTIRFPSGEAAFVLAHKRGEPRPEAVGR
jgi:4-amino-4-deoxy-L-arabinose transferase-like glycosyltransferase